MYDLVKWRKTVATCAQDDFLFNTTLEENLTILASASNSKKVNEVIQKVELVNLIQRLPQGLKTVVGEQGGYLSGGEKKRCLIARTLLRDSKLYIFDEPFAELDEHTAKLVLDGILSLTRGKTLIVISHLPWGLENFDEIVVFEAGRISQHGNHQTLIDEDGYYSRLYWANTRQASN